MLVLLVFEYPTLNGGENSLLSILNGLIQLGIRFESVAPGNSPLVDELKSLNIPVHVYPEDNQTGRSAKESKRIFIETMVATVRPNLIHANSLSMSRMVGPIATKQGCPSVGHLRDIIKIKAQVTTDLNQNSHLIAVSNATRNCFIDQGVDREKISTVYNGIDISRFRPRPATGYLHQELGLPSDFKIVVTIGQIGLRKATDVFLDAAARIADVPNCVFLVVGERNSTKQESIDFERQLHEVSERRPLAGRVFFLGRRNDVSSILNEATVLANFAKQEPFGRVLLEAAASGCCVVATNVGGTSEIFPTIATAQLVPAGDGRAAALGLRRLLLDEDLRKEQSKAARQRVVSSFTVDKCVEETQKIYSQAAPSRRRFR